MEIAEDEEEDKRASIVVEERLPSTKAPSLSVPQVAQSPPGAQSPEEESAINFRSTVTDTDNTSPPSLPPVTDSDPRPKSPARSFDERRKSSQSTRAELHSYSSYSGKPKIKLGPRPSLDITSRPHTSASNNFRPVSTLPPGLKLFSRGSKKSKERPQSQHPNGAPSMTLSPPSISDDIKPQTVTLIRPHTSGGRPTSSGGVSTRPPLSPSAIVPKMPTMTPEKARLMKALQMRKKQMSAPAVEEVSPSNTLSPAMTGDSLKFEAAEMNQSTQVASKEVTDTLATLSDISTADSGIASEASSVETMGGSQTTRTSSNPTSPIEQSERDSTQASSISESTDETVRDSEAKEEMKSEDPMPSPTVDISAVQEAHDKLTGAIEAQKEHADSLQSEKTEKIKSEDPVSSQPKDVSAVQKAHDKLTEAIEGQEEQAESSQSVVEMEIKSEDPVPSQPENVSTVQEAHDALTGATEVREEQVETLQSEGKKTSGTEAVLLESADIMKSSTLDENSASRTSRREFAAEATPQTETSIDNISSSTEEIAEGSEFNEQSTKPVVEQILIPRSTFNKSFVPDEPKFETTGPAAPSDQPVLLEVTNSAPKEDQKPTMKDLLETADAQSPVREWKIPRSKFSVQDLKASTASAPSTGRKSPVDSTFSNDSKRSLSDDEREDGASDQKRKRHRGLLEPLRTEIDKSGNNSETDFLSDDDLMDELQSAQVHEAKPIMVSKSPITPGFPNQLNRGADDDSRFSRAFSNPFSKNGPKIKDLSQGKGGVPSRSVSASAAYLNRINQQQSAPIVKKVNLGSGISQRIKALERLSTAPTAATTVIAPPIPSPSFFSTRKAGRKSPSIAERAESLTRNTPSPSISRDSSPETQKFRSRSESIQSRSNAFALHSQNPPQRSRPESISVTARIVRDPNQPLQLKPEMPHKDPLDYTPLDLKQSTLVIDHQKAVTLPQPPKITLQARRLSKEQPKNDTTKERRSSIGFMKDLISDGRSSLSDRRTSFSGSRTSMTIEPTTFSPSIKSPSRPPSTHVSSPNLHGRPTSVSSSRRSNSSRDLSGNLTSFGSQQNQSVPTTPSNDEEAKKSGRASRMLRRMSSSISSSRKSLAHAISPTVREESEPPQTGTQSLAPSQLSQSSLGATVSIEIGDVNVQFPDTLLWKRRSMSIDSQGNLLLLQAQGSKGMEKSTGNKRYHLSEFRTPYIPEMEVQELPNSVVLDFIDGSGLQIACEDRGGQARVLGGS
jgi:hypothetical protein